jgi:protein-S-isoprenylcysteine O-methyltransferase Ste14
MPARFLYFTRGLWNWVSLGLALALKALAGSSVPPWAYGLLGAVVLAAQGWRIWGAGFIGRAAREGTPVGEALVTAGPFAYVRNPMYLGTAIGLLAFAGMSGLWYAVLAVVAILTVVYAGSIAYEEAFLSARFGEEYRRYREAVPRLLQAPRAPAHRQARPPAEGRFRLADGLVNESVALILLPVFFALFWFVG